jgi:hypothetical protein
MIDLLQVAQTLQNLAESRDWKFCFIGGLALQRWGEPRVTVDIDMTLFTGFGGELPYIRQLLKHYRSRIDEAESFALDNRVVLLESDTGIGIDISLAGLEYEAALIGRSTEFEFLPKLSLRTCSAEDLIVLKAFADRSRDWADIEGVVLRQGENIDWDWIYKSLTPLCEPKENLSIIIDRLKQLREA